MAMPSVVATEGAPRRVVLIDFDWQDSDLVPELLHRPGVSVRLVAGERPDDAGLRMAEMCGLPRTVDLADLTREIFDLALVGERSKRRTQIEGLLLALGTPCASPQGFLAGADSSGDHRPGIEAPLSLHAAAFENAIGGEPFDAIMEQTLPDYSTEDPTAPAEVTPSGRSPVSYPSLDDFPSPEDRRGLETALGEMMENTGASCAQIHAGRSDSFKLVAQVGRGDSLLQGLVDLALEMNSAQVVSRLNGPQEGRAWGAWPFRTTQRRGVIAAAAIDPASGWTRWESMVEELRATWDQRDREQSAPAFPMVPGAQPGWLDIPDFHGRIGLAVERNGRDGLRFELHHLLFPGGPDAVGLLCQRLPDQMRDTDCLCRPGPQRMLLLTAGAANQFVHLRRRLLGLWEGAWAECGMAPPAPPIQDEHVAMASPADAAGFQEAASRWLA